MPGHTCRELHARLRRDCGDSSFEIVIVSNTENGDGDRTPQVAASLAAYYPEVPAELAPHAPGKGAALKWGTNRTRGRIVAFVDVDLPFGSEFLVRALHEARQGSDLVIANRRLVASDLGLTRSVQSTSYRRHLFGTAFNKLVRSLLPVTCTDTQAGGKAMRREFALDAFDRVRCTGFLFDLEILLTAECRRKAVTELPVLLRPRGDESTVRIASQLVHSLFWLIRIAIRNHRGCYSDQSPPDFRSALLPDDYRFMDFTLYWFMFPVSILVATSAMLSGIGGAALFTPIFILVFPMLGPEYPLASTVAAIGTALLTETFGFTSGFVGYFRKHLIDFAIVWRFLVISVPVAVTGAFLAHFVPGGYLIAGYALLVFVLAIVHVFVPHDEVPARKAIDDGDDPEIRHKIDSRGREYVYRIPHLGVSGAVFTGVGSFLTGMLSVGIGEVIVPQLTKRGVPIAIAVAASVTIVIVTVACASFTLIAQLISEGGVAAVPWNLVVYSIPGVIIGGQIGPRLQGLVSHRSMEHAIGALFFMLSGAMLLVALQRLGIA